MVRIPILWASVCRIIFGIIYKLHFTPGNLYLQKLISEIYTFFIECNSTKLSGNTIFHVQHWNYDDDESDAIRNQEIQVLPPPTPIMTSSQNPVVSLTQKQLLW